LKSGSGIVAGHRKEGFVNVTKPSQGTAGDCQVRRRDIDKIRKRTKRGARQEKVRPIRKKGGAPEEEKLIEEGKTIGDRSQNKKRICEQ